MYQPTQLIETIRATKEGATLQEDGTQATINKGFMVSVTDTQINATQEAKEDFLLMALDKLHTFKNMLPISNSFIGVWRDGETLYLDISVNVASLAEALIIGKFFNQKAVFDLENMKSIYL